MPARMPQQEPATGKAPSLQERGGLQLDLRRNLFQLAVATLLTITGVAVGGAIGEDEPGRAAVAGGFVGMVAGALLSGLVLMLWDYPYPGYVLKIPPGPMTGQDHLRLQRQRLDRVVYYGLLLLLPASIWLLFARSMPVTAIIVVASCAAFAGIAILLRPRCPFCSRTLALRWPLPDHKFCPHCGWDFTATVDASFHDGQDGGC